MLSGQQNNFGEDGAVNKELDKEGGLKACCIELDNWEQERLLLQ